MFSVTTMTCDPTTSGSAHTAASTVAVHAEASRANDGSAVSSPLRDASRWYVNHAAAESGCDVEGDALGCGALGARVSGDPHAETVSSNATPPPNRGRHGG